MTYTDNALNILTTMIYKGIKNAWITNNLKGNEDIDTIISLLNKKLDTNENDFFERREKIEYKINNLSNCDGVIAIGDKNFPQSKYNIKGADNPVCLFYKGDIKLLQNQLNITVIGLLNPTKEIEQRERKLIEEILKFDANIISGLALGCDSISHKVAVENDRPTIAILPNHLDEILPRQNTELAQDIVYKGGLLLTEYYTPFNDIRELSSRYIQRDRLQAIFSDGVILAASYAQNSAFLHKELEGKKLDSGARHAIETAFKYNIPIGVMYNENLDATNPMFDLNREIIKEKEAIILTQKTLQNFIFNKKQKNITIQATLEGLE